MIHRLFLALILCLGATSTVYSATVEVNNDGDMVLEVAGAKDVLIQKGNVTIDIVAEAKLARREAAGNTAAIDNNGECDSTLTSVVDKIAGMITGQEAGMKEITAVVKSVAKMLSDVEKSRYVRQRTT